MTATCTCGASPGTLHRITCMEAAAESPNAMVNDEGDVFYPDGAEDAAYFAEHHGAYPLRTNPAL